MAIPESPSNRIQRLKKEEALSASEMRRRFHYDPDTGIFTRLTGRLAGERAGHRTNRGYLVFTVSSTVYYAHRAAWLYMTGEWPIGQLDHQDNNRSNNAWSNLREATNSQNNANRGIRRSGLKGVTRRGPRLWRAQLMQNYRMVLSREFDCPAAAHLAYVVESSKRFGEFARAR